MHLLSEREKKIEKAIKTLETSGVLHIHINGENYCDDIYLHRDSADGLIYVKYETTCELVPTTKWAACEDWQEVIRKYIDWL